MRNLSRGARSVLTLPVLALLVAGVTGVPGAQADKWRTVNRADTKVVLKNWPDELPCTYRDGGYNANYSQKRTSIFCPRVPYHDGDRTYVNVSELQPGYYWSGGYGGDVRQHRIFKRDKGYYAYFKSAVFPEGQDFKCYGSTRCGFRNIRFSVGEKPCQLVHYNPDIGTTDGWTGQGEAPFNVLLIQCGTVALFTPEHFRLEPNSVTITFPQVDALGGGNERRDLGADVQICRLALNGDQSGWQVNGFADYVDVAKRRRLSLADCRGILERVAIKDNDRKPPAPPPPRGGFADCFDNPQNCK